MKRIKKTLFPAYIAILGRLPTRWSIALEHFRRVGRWPDLDDPKTFNEKIQWRKLHGDHALYARLSDKVLVKDHVAAILGKDFVTPTFWHGTTLPPRAERNWPFPYVIKANHDSGSVMFVRNESEQDWDLIEKTCDRWLGKPFTPYQKENWYHSIDPKILIEPFLGKDLIDYKMYVFDGKVCYIHINTDRFIAHKVTFFDRDWNKQKFTRYYPFDDSDILPPVHFSKMVRAAETLADGMDFVRVDFYDLPEGPRFGEMTFAPGSGYEPFDPPEYDRIMGESWTVRRG